MFRIPLIRPTVGKEELEAIKKVFESGWLTQGPETYQFEKELADYLQVSDVITTPSGTAALHLMTVCAGIKRGDEVIIPDYTFPATGNVIFHCGARPVLCDIRLREFQIDPEQIEKLITKRTVAIMPVSEFGLTADMRWIMDIADDHDLRVLEDAAPAIGSKRYGQFAGTFGDMGGLSFHPRKLLGIGEGGAVITKNKRLAKMARILRNHGQTDKWNFLYAGYNYRLSSIQAAIGRVQLTKLPRTILDRREGARYYNEGFADVKGITIPEVPPECFHTYQSYVILFDRPARRIINYIREKGIEVQIGTTCLSLLPSFYYARKGRGKRDECLYSKIAYKQAMTLPLYDTLTYDEQDEVINEVIKAVDRYG